MGGKTEKTTQSKDMPAEYLMPHINTLLGGARSLYGAGPPQTGGGFFNQGGGQSFQGARQPMPMEGIPSGGQPTYAEFSPTTERALSGIEERAAAGSPVFRAGSQGLMDTIQGKYLTPDSNPYLRSYYDAAAGGVQDRINAEFSKAGRYSSGSHAGTTARELGDLAAKIYAPAYEAERGRMFGALGQAIPFANEEYRDPQNMLMAGQIRDAKAQQVVDDPYERLRRYLSIVRGVPQGREGSSVETVTSTPGALDIIGGLGSIAAIPMTGGTSLLGTFLGGLGGK